MFNPDKEIINAHKVIDFFGKWPSFHDSEIIEAKLNRENISLEMKLFTFETVKEVDEKGYFKLDKQCIITMRFLPINEIELVDFNQQNVIFGLEFEKTATGDIKVDIKPCYGLSGTFTCKEIEVISLQPYNS